MKKELSFLDKKIIASLVQKTRSDSKIKDLKITSFPELFKHLNKKEIVLIKKFLKLDPRNYGFKGAYLGIQDPPRDIVAIKNQKYTFRRKDKIVSVQYLPKEVYSAYQKLNRAIKKDLKTHLLIDSGYRSPANQILVFLYYLQFHKFDFLKTASRVAFPGCSEHGAPQRQAIDFLTPRGIPSDEAPLNFQRTKEYRWLLNNANRFGFYLSYPKDNPDGIMFEPWHWHFEK